MATLSHADVARLARLARIELTDAELDHFAGQLGAVLDAVAAVGEVAADELPPMSHAVPMTNVFRPDEVRPCLTPEEALGGAPVPPEEQRFRVPQILGDEQ
jgi:aspartyl-tRNA(Asn)/glutamyl-tRNA(Gln) amidotransferase subunit C